MTAQNTNTTCDSDIMDSQKPFCRTCDVHLGEGEAYRTHVKSEWHVYKLQCRIAPSGTQVPLPSQAPEAGDGKPKAPQVVAQQDGESEPDSTSDESQSEESDDSDKDDATPEFISDECLFCNQRCGSFEANMAHMSKGHSFTVPHQSALDVDVDTLIWYLHLVIRGYHECILCGTRRNTAEAAQQHMMGKGHCRCDLSGDLVDFYDLAKLASQTTDGFVRPDEASMRLPSGKLLTHRSHAHLSARPHFSRQASEERQQLPSSEAIPSRSNALEKRDKKAGSLTTQISRLSANDQRGLIHLPPAEQRSALATMKKQSDFARREERRSQLRMGRRGNGTLMKHFKPDVPGPQNG